MKLFIFIIFIGKVIDMTVSYLLFSVFVQSINLFSPDTMINILLDIVKPASSAHAIYCIFL